MKRNTHFTQVALAAILLSMSHSVFAADLQQTDAQTNPESETKMKQRTVAPSLGDRTPPASSPSFVINASFLYWQADMEDLSPGVASTTSIGSSSTTGSSQDVKMDFKWEPGFKLGVGMIFGERDQYDARLNWTWIQPKGSASSSQYAQLGSITIDSFTSDMSVDSGSFVVPGYSPQASGSPSSYVSSRWELQYNTVDLEFGRNFFLGKNLTLRPFGGLRGAWLNNHLNESYAPAFTSVSFTEQTLPGGAVVNSGSPMQASQSAKFEYHGVGLRLGSDLYWNFTNHFAGYGTISGTIFYGYEEVEQNFSRGYNNLVIDGTPTTESYLLPKSYSTSDHTSKTALQGLLGIMWHTGFDKSGMHFYVGAAYEVNQWFHLNSLRTILHPNTPYETATARNGNLGLHGLTFDVRLDF